MSDDKPEFPSLRTATALAPRTADEAKALARRAFGEPPPDELRFHCMTCGWNNTLKFAPDEIAALDGDIRGYHGPCAECKCMTLVPHDSFLAGTNIERMAEENFYRQVDQAADVVLDKIEERIGTYMGGGKKEEKTEEAKKEILRDDLPDAATVMGEKK